MYTNEQFSHINMYGYREELDKYFNSLDNKQLNIEKPVPNIPKKFLEIINFLDKSKLLGRRKLSSFLLDFAEDAKLQLITAIERILTRQNEIKRMTQLSLMGGIPMCLFCHQPSISEMSEEQCKKYTMATMLKTKDEFRLELHLYYDDNNVLNNVKFEFYKYDDIPQEQIEELKLLGDNIVTSRIEKSRKVTGKKIGRNDPCPCGILNTKRVDRFVFYTNLSTLPPQDKISILFSTTLFIFFATSTWTRVISSYFFTSNFSAFFYS